MSDFAGPSNSAVSKWTNIPRIQRKEYERNARITRNELRHEAANKSRVRPVTRADMNAVHMQDMDVTNAA